MTEKICLREASHVVGKSLSAIRQAAHRGQINTTKLGNALFIRESDLMLYLLETDPQWYDNELCTC